MLQFLSMVSRKYKKSPIKEAIFDLRFTGALDSEEVLVDEFFEKIKTDYPIKEELHSTDIQFLKEEGKKPIISHEADKHYGFRFLSSNKKKIISIRKANLGFSQLEPYESWEMFSEEAKKILQIYIEIFKYNLCERIALRYVNAIDIPESSFDISDYLITQPTIAPSLPQGLVHFFFRLTVKDEETGSFAHLNEVMEINKITEKPRFLFDIDVFQTELKLEPNSSEFWKRFEIIKRLRTRLFEESITDKTRELFD